MGFENVPLVAFNRGLISQLGLARTDIKRTALSAEVQTNLVPRVLGSMMLKPGFGYTGATLNNNKAFSIPFVFNNSDTARIEVTDSNSRVIVNDVPVTRVAVATAVTNADFSSGMGTGWNNSDESGAASTISGGFLNLKGTGFATAITAQSITVAGGDQAKEHALRIVVTRGPVTFKLGTSSGADDLINTTTLGTGTHSLAFTPNAGTVYILFSSIDGYTKIIDSCTIESAGVMVLPTPWLVTDLPFLRHEASADVTYVDCQGYQQRKYERRSTTSWSIVLYEPLDGPFRNINTSVVSLTPSAITGDITLTASRNIFYNSMIGTLFRINSIGQTIAATFSGDDQFSDPIKIIGASTQRTINVVITGTFVGKLTLQRSVGDIGAWVDVGTSWTTTITTTYNDALDNQIIFYRVGIKSGDYTSGTPVATLSNPNGSLSGIVKITAYSSPTSVSASVIDALGGTAGSTLWQEGEWSNYRGWPSSCIIHEGRLFHVGKAKAWGSVSDAYESFDDTTVGDSGPINRSFGKGPVDAAIWTLSLQRLLIGGSIAEWSARSNSFDEPLTPTNFNTRSPSSRGSANVQAIQVDDRGLFVSKSGTRLFELSYQQGSIIDYSASNMCELIPEIGLPSIVKIAVQREPDTRIHCIRADGSVAILISQPAEEVMCWIVINSLGAAGLIEDVCILPGVPEDQVYYTINRTVNASTVRYHEKWAIESDCQGGAINKQADSFITYNGAPTNVIPGATHLVGQTVVIWGDGKDLGTAVVANDGTVTIPNAVTVSAAMVGLGYVGQFKSSKLAYAAMQGTALTMRKKIDHLGLILLNSHYQGLKYGPDFSTLQALPKVYKGKVMAADTVYSTHDTDPVWFAGKWDTDSRLCLQMAAPRPCTILGAIVALSENG